MDWDSRSGRATRTMAAYLRVNMQPSCVSRVQNVSPSGSGLSFDGKTRMFRRVFFCMFLLVFLGCVFGVCCAYIAYLIGL